MKAIRKVPNSDRRVRAEPVFATLGDVPTLRYLLPPTYLFAYRIQCSRTCYQIHVQVHVFCMLSRAVVHYRPIERQKGIPYAPTLEKGG